ncbi:MAG: hypothetical protein JO048_00120 [Methylobacteriaceae bacterium]|nr:hypothetical protein [Methylobacteriaceae bacterium]
MSNRRRQDPYRRKPPTIDLTAIASETAAAAKDESEMESAKEAETEAAREDETASAGAAAAAEAEVPTAIEPVAATGLDDATSETAELATSGRVRVFTADEPAAVPAAEASPPADEMAAARPATLPVGPEPAAMEASSSDPVAGPAPDAPAPAPASEAVLEAGPEPISASATSRSALGGFAASRSAEVEGAEPAARSAEPDPAASRKAAAEPRRSAGSLLAASLVGGLVGGGLVFGSGYLTRGPGGDDGGLARRVATLEQRAAAPSSAAVPNPEATAGLDRRVAALETERQGLAAEIATLHQQASARDGAAGNAAPAASPAAGPDPAVAELGQRVGALEGLGPRLAQVEARSGEAAPAKAVDELSSRIAGLADGLKQAQAETGRIGELSGRVDALGTKLDESGRQTAEALTGLQGATREHGERLQTISADLGKLPPALLQAGLRAVVVGRVSDALRAGAPIGPALGALDRLGTDPAALAPLKPYAEAAPPTAPALAAEFKPLGERMLSEPARPAESIGDRLIRMADKIVTVRAIGDGSGQDVPGLVARIESALNRGALADAAASFDALPEATRQPAAAWAAKLKARVAADKAVAAISSQALGALDAPAR